MTGKGRFLASDTPADCAHAVVVRSAVPSGRIVSVATDGAQAAPGVRLVLTGEDVAATLPVDLTAVNAPAAAARAQPALAKGRVRYVGEPVAFVVADTADLARDAAERVAVTTEEAPAVTDLEAAWRERIPAWGTGPNIVARHEAGDAGATKAAFERAARVIALRVPVNRVDPAPMEPRSCRATVADGAITLTVGTQRAHAIQRPLADGVFGIDRAHLRVVSPDSGGGFGQKNSAYPEHVLCIEAAKRLGRPVAWEADRTESFAAGNHARESLFDVRAAIDETGRVRAIEVARAIALGAYVSPRGLVMMVNGLSHLTGVYGIEAAFVTVEGVLTNTAPTCPYRGAGRPEVVLCCERMMDAIAHTLGEDPLAFRRKNLVRAAQMPFEAPLGGVLDRIDAPALLRVPPPPTVGAERWGRGIALFAENLGAPPEPATVRLVAEGDGLRLITGTGSAGQGHETVFPALVAARLGLDPLRIAFTDADTAAMADGIGTAASWSLTLAGNAADRAADAAIARGAEIAARALGVLPSAIDFDAGLFRARGRNTALGWTEIFAREPEFAVTGAFTGEKTLNAGCHVADVAVDVETGAVRILGLSAVHDVGTVMDETIATGQLHGALTQGIGQAACEAVRYDAETGQLLTASFMDYALPRADDVPRFDTAFVAGARPKNPIGVTGLGEAGATGATAAVLNAVINALTPLGVTTIDMPLTPERVWRAIRTARRPQGAPGGPA